MLEMGNLEAGTPDAGAARKRARHGRRLVLALVAAIVMAAGVLAFLALVVVPYASAAGGCGGG
jgi:hypothetical protein